jgi:hypothetical protein
VRCRNEVTAVVVTVVCAAAAGVGCVAVRLLAWHSLPQFTCVASMTCARLIHSTAAVRVSCWAPSSPITTSGTVTLLLMGSSRASLASMASRHFRMAPRTSSVLPLELVPDTVLIVAETKPGTRDTKLSPVDSRDEEVYYFMNKGMLVELLNQGGVTVSH